MPGLSRRYRRTEWASARRRERYFLAVPSQRLTDPADEGRRNGGHWRYRLAHTATTVMRHRRASVLGGVTEVGLTGLKMRDVTLRGEMHGQFDALREHGRKALNQRDDQRDSQHTVLVAASGSMRNSKSARLVERRTG